MAINTGPYEVQDTYDPSYTVALGYLAECGFWFVVVDGQGAEVDGLGANSELPHLIQLIEASRSYFSWADQGGLVLALIDCDPALRSRVSSVRKLVGAALAA